MAVQAQKLCMLFVYKDTTTRQANRLMHDGGETPPKKRQANRHAHDGKNKPQQDTWVN